MEPIVGKWSIITSEMKEGEMWKMFSEYQKEMFTWELRDNGILIEEVKGAPKKRVRYAHCPKRDLLYVDISQRVPGGVAVGSDDVYYIEKIDENELLLYNLETGTLKESESRIRIKLVR